MDNFLEMMQCDEEELIRRDQLYFLLSSTQLDEPQPLKNIMETGIQVELPKLDQFNQESSSCNKEPSRIKEQNKKKTKESRDVQKYGRYDTLLGALKFLANYDKGIEKKVKTKISNQRSYFTYFLWLKLILKKQKIDLQLLQEKAFEIAGKKYGSRNQIFQTELKEEIIIMMRATELFMEGEPLKGIELAYKREKCIGTTHKTSKNFMHECIDLVFQPSEIQEFSNQVNHD